MEKCLADKSGSNLWSVAGKIWKKVWLPCREKNCKVNWKVSLAAKERTGNLSKFGPIGCLQQMYSLLLSGLCNRETVIGLSSGRFLSHREACSERSAAAMGLAQLPGEEKAGSADMVLPNKEEEICCFILGLSSPAQVCFLILKHFQGKLRMKSNLCSCIHCIKSRAWVWKYG